MPDPPSDVRDLIRSYFAACSAGDAEAVAAHFTQDATIYDTNHAPLQGREAIGKFWARIHEQWAGARWVLGAAVVEGDAAAIEWSMHGTHENEPFVVRGSEHYSVESGLIAEIRQYWTFDPASPGSELQDYDYTDTR